MWCACLACVCVCRCVCASWPNSSPRLQSQETQHSLVSWEITCAPKPGHWRPAHPPVCHLFLSFRNLVSLSSLLFLVTRLFLLPQLFAARCDPPSATPDRLIPSSNSPENRTGSAQLPIGKLSLGQVLPLVQSAVAVVLGAGPWREWPMKYPQRLRPLQVPAPPEA